MVNPQKVSEGCVNLAQFLGGCTTDQLDPADAPMVKRIIDEAVMKLNHLKSKADCEVLRARADAEVPAPATMYDPDIAPSARIG